VVEHAGAVRAHEHDAPVVVLQELGPLGLALPALRPVVGRSRKVYSCYNFNLPLRTHSTCTPACLPACLPTYLPACLPACLPAYLPTYLPTCGSHSSSSLNMRGSQSNCPSAILAQSLSCTFHWMHGESGRRAGGRAGGRAGRQAGRRSRGILVEQCVARAWMYVGRLIGILVVE
jgi:hypothetical protein